MTWHKNGRRFDMANMILPRMQWRLQRVIDYIDEHLAGNLSLTELAQLANLSTSHFKLLFRESIGMPVHQYIIHRRVDYAMQLVLHGRLPLSEIALLAGFSNQSHMASCMRRVAGLTPGMLKRGDLEIVPQERKRAVP